MRIYGCQFDIQWEAKQANFARVQTLITGAQMAPGSLLLLPEMFATGFSMHVESVAEDAASGETAAFLRTLAHEQRVHVIGGLVTQRTGDGMGRNELLVVSPAGELAARYAKIHPFSYGEESRHYVGGEEIVTFAWAGAVVAPFICYDLRFPEVFRHAVRRGAEVLTVIANWPAAREGHWVALAKARAIENQAYVACVNRVGVEQGKERSIAYGGRSMVIDPRGNVIAEAGAGEEVVSAEIDLVELREYRRTFPALADMRPRFLGEA